MSFRSPTPDGLAISPNAAAFGGNPAASPQELQVHHYWGRYGLTTQLPNIGFLDGVAVVGTNPASAPAYNKLAPGDLGFVEGAAPPSVSNMYVCVDRGTLAGNDARWVTLGNAAFTQTIRDAHVIVVGQGGGAVQPLATLFAATPPPANQLNLSATGDVASITCDFLDSGDGAQLQLALAAAAAAGTGIDVRLRPCSITLDSTTVGTDGFVIPQGCRLIGAGYFSSRLFGTDGTGGVTQTVVTMQTEASIEDILVSSPPPVAAPGGTQLGVIVMGAASLIRRCAVDLAGSVTIDRVQTYGIHCPFPDGDELVDDCDLTIDSLAGQATPAISRGISFGPADGSSYPDLAFDSEVRNTTISGAGSVLGSCPLGVSFQNMSGGRCFNVEHRDAHLPQGAFSWSWSATSAVVRTVRGPRFIECRMVATDDEATSQFGILLLVAGTPNLTAIIGTVIEDCAIRFTPNGAPSATITKHAYRIQNVATDASPCDVSDISIVGCKAFFAHRGFVLTASAGAATTGRIVSALLAACHARNMLGTGVQTARGLYIEGNTNNNGPSVLNVGAQNCDFSSVAANGIGLNVANVRVSNTIAIGCNLVPLGGGTALTDSGTGTEAAHNILV